MQSYTNKYTNVILMIIAMSMLAGCSMPSTEAALPETLNAQSAIVPGGVVALGFGATVAKLGQVAASAPGTFIYASENMKNIMFCWPQGANYGFFAIGNKTGLIEPVRSVQAMMNGNATNAATMTNLLKELELNGWKEVFPSQLPPAVLVALQGATYWLRDLATINPVLPIFIMPNPALSPMPLGKLPPL